MAKRRYVWILVFLLGFSSPTFAYFEMRNYLDLDTGYRWDKIYNRVAIYGPGAAVGVRASTQAANTLNSYQLGAKGRWTFYDKAYLRGSGHYGWLGGGTYDESSFIGDAGGNTWDATGGVGYLFRFHPCWAVAPVLGWSYDQLNITGKHIIPPFFILRDLGNIKYKSTFQGPWGGVDFLFQPTCCTEIVINYELHHAHWHGTKDQNDFPPQYGTSTAFASRRSHPNIWGNVFQIDGTYYLHPRLNIGLSLKYQTWMSQGRGKYQRTKTPLSPVFTNRVVEDVEWNSFSLMAHFGYSF